MRICALLIYFFSFCCLPAFSKEKAVPKEGEGIYRFLINNGRDPQKQFKEFVELNKDKLGKNNSLKKGVSYELPALPKSTETDVAENETNSRSKINKGRKRIEPLFGKKYSEYTVVSDRLRGATFFLSSGHGGPDSGAVGVVDGFQIHEDEYAYDITLRLARCLMMEGATVYMIIQDKTDGIRDDKFLKSNKTETCRGKIIPLNQKKRLQQRCDEINKLSNRSKDKYQRTAFIHLDSRSDSHQLDVFFYHASTSTSGKRLCNTMRRTFKDHYQKHQPGRGFTGTVSGRDLYVLVNSKPTALFAELGNIKNSFDQRRFLESSNRQALANWMCRGFITDYENTKSGL